MPDNTQNKRPINFYRLNVGDNKKWLDFNGKTQDDIAFIDETGSIFVGDKEYINRKSLVDSISAAAKNANAAIEKIKDSFELFKEWINYNEALNRYDKINFFAKLRGQPREIEQTELIEKVYFLAPWHLRVSLSELLNSIYLYTNKDTGKKEPYNNNFNLGSREDTRFIEISGPTYKSDFDKNLYDLYKPDPNKYTPEDNLIAKSPLGGNGPTKPTVKYTVIVPPFGTTPYIINKNTLGLDSILDDGIYSRRHVLNYHRDLFGTRYYVPDYNIKGDGWLTNEDYYTKYAIVGANDFIIEAYCCNPNFNHFDSTGKTFGTMPFNKFRSESLLKSLYILQDNDLSDVITDKLGGKYTKIDDFVDFGPFIVYAHNIDKYIKVTFKYITYLPTIIQKSKNGTLQDVEYTKADLCISADEMQSIRLNKLFNKGISGLLLGNELVKQIGTNISKIAAFHPSENDIRDNDALVVEQYPIFIPVGRSLNDVFRFACNLTSFAGIFSRYSNDDIPKLDKESIKTISELPELLITDKNNPSYNIKSIPKGTFIINEKQMVQLGDVFNDDPSGDNTTGFFGLCAGNSLLTSVADDFIYIDPDIICFPGSTNNDNPVYQPYKPFDGFSFGRCGDYTYTRGLSYESDKIGLGVSANGTINSYKRDEGVSINTIISYNIKDLNKLDYQEDFSDEDDTMGVPLSSWDCHFNINISYAFSMCVNLEGSSPSLTFRGNKYKLWEINTPYEEFYGKPLFKWHEGVFRGCEKLTDYAQIPDDWK